MLELKFKKTELEWILWAMEQSYNTISGNWDSLLHNIESAKKYIEEKDEDAEFKVTIKEKAMTWK